MVQRPAMLFAKFFIPALGFAVGLALAVPAGAQGLSDDELWFESRVRPLLVEHCIECHGPETQESGLRLDSRAGFVRGGNRGQAAEPGQPDHSLLVTAIEYRDDELQMPPDGPLPPDAVAVLREWIGRGAPWPKDEQGTPEANAADVGDGRASSAWGEASGHWAFQPIRDPSETEGGGETVAQHPIDRILDRGLERIGARRGPRADARTLVRRATFDLWGLPPSYDDVQRFMADPTEAAWRAMIKRLLDDRAYGERWARHWLDVARYADTKGYVDGGQPENPFAYTYRDYVIRALNEDLPLDQFITDQLAADQLQLGDDQRWRLAGLGFLTVGRRFNFNVHDTRDDQIDVVSRGLLGLTISCARCHDHKYDPISAVDYYGLYGIFANTFEPTYAELPLVEAEPDAEPHAKYLSELRVKRDEYEQYHRELAQKIGHEMRAFATDYLVYLVRESPVHRDGPSNPLATGRAVLRGPTAYGAGAIARWRQYIASRADNDAVFGVWKAMWPIEPAEFERQMRQLLDHPGEANEELIAQLRREPPRSMIELARAYGGLLERVDATCRERMPDKPGDAALDTPGLEQIRDLLYGPHSPMTMTDEQTVDCYLLDEHVADRNKRGEIEKVAVGFEQAAGRAMVVRELSEPYQGFVFVRGDPTRPGRAVQRSLPRLLQWMEKKREGSREQRLEATLQKTPEQTAEPTLQKMPEQTPEAFAYDEFAYDEATGAVGRLELARAIVDPRNPLTARVMVNRVWSWHFGQPLVDTPSDFGTRCDRPVQSELLDYLAHWLIQHDWSLKQLHRLIMTSETYRQSSSWGAAGRDDPENLYWWRYPGHRAEWEVVRDSLLSVSGHLEPRAGGRAVAASPTDLEATCRTIYLRLDRQQIPSVALAFDFPSPDMSAGKRNRTAVPQQQLFFLNNPLVIRQAERLSQQLIPTELSDESRQVKWLFRRVLARDPSPEEVAAALGLLHADAEPVADTDLAGPNGTAETAGTEQPIEAAWTRIAHALLQSNEFLWIE